ncbi:metal-binding protein [Dyella jiangningensis]|nr:metal-binding protein [Dyella jiangningensis]AHX13414.1 metal-binding protein [Dyella jiangningensis]
MKPWLSRLYGLALMAAACAPAAMAANAIEVYRDPSCGCCAAWVRYLRNQGYTVSMHQDEPMARVKARFGVPDRAVSCHTAVVDGYVIEGHVPAKDIRRLLAEHPDVRGLAAPGMPMGSPGMEMGNSERYNVLLIARDGSTRVFATHGPA